MKILLVGKNGQIGWELNRSLSLLGKLCTVGYPEIDLANPDSVRECVNSVNPGVIVNAAAYTAVDHAEKEPDLAMKLNGIAPGVFAEEAKKAEASQREEVSQQRQDAKKIDAEVNGGIQELNNGTVWGGQVGSFQMVSVAAG